MLKIEGTKLAPKTTSFKDLEVGTVFGDQIGNVFIKIPLAELDSDVSRFRNAMLLKKAGDRKVFCTLFCFAPGDEVTPSRINPQP